MHRTCSLGAPETPIFNRYRYKGGKEGAQKGTEGGLEGGLVDAMPHLLGYETSLSMLLNA